MFITLKCRECDNIDCPIAREYIPDDSIEGCTKDVTEEDAEKFYYYTEEILPFVRQYENFDVAQKRLDEIYIFLNHLYGLPTGNKLDSKGKVIRTPRKSR